MPIRPMRNYYNQQYYICQLMTVGRRTRPVWARIITPDRQSKYADAQCQQMLTINIALPH